MFFDFRIFATLQPIRMKLLVGFGLFVPQVFAQTIDAPIIETKTVDVKNNSWFVGVEGGASKLYDKGRENADYNTKDYGVKFGYILAPEFRVYAAYAKNTGIEDESYFYYGSTRIDAKLDGDVSKFYIGTDSFHFITENFKFLAGLSFGYAKLNLDYTASYGGYSVFESASDSGLTIGSKLGFSYDISKHSEIESGIKGAYYFLMKPFII
jgi:hypothetical protein